jgi:hypothetical protein
MDLEYGGAGQSGDYGSTRLTLAGPLFRGPTGQFVVTLHDAGLASEEDAVNTIAHELNHIREVMATGEWPAGEGPATAAGNTAEQYFIP